MISLLAKAVCLARGHDDIRVIDRIEPIFVQRGDDRVEFAGKIKSVHLHCMRCRRDAQLPSGPTVVSRRR